MIISPLKTELLLNVYDIATVAPYIYRTSMRSKKSTSATKV